VGGDWQPRAAVLTLAFGCLRRDADGSRLEETVDLALSRVTAIAVAFDPFWPEERPSGLRVPPELRIERLDPWPLAAREAEAVLDDDDAIEAVELAARTDWVAGDLASLAAARHRLTLHAGDGIPRIHRRIAIGFEEAAPSAGGRPLAWCEWAQQYEAWWLGWRQHHDEARGEESGPDTGDDDPIEEEDAFIPAGQDAPADPDYSIAEPVVDLDPHDAPEDLLRPVLDWFETRRASGSTEDDIDMVHARSIDGWWIEGRRANVRVLGVQHYPPCDGEPADSVISAWSFALRRSGDRWSVRGWTSRRADRPMPAWTARWTAGPLRID
jgi:hypothetical protein